MYVLTFIELWQFFRQGSSGRAVKGLLAPQARPSRGVWGHAPPGNF